MFQGLAAVLSFSFPCGSSVFTDTGSGGSFGIIIKHTERKGNETTTVSSIIGLETWVKNDDTATLELLKKGKEITVEGFFKPENYTKDGKNVTVLKNIATKVTAFVREEKQDAPKAKNRKAK